MKIKPAYLTGIICVVLYVLYSSASSQSDEILNAIDLPEIISSSFSFEKAVLSPNGRFIAWIETYGVCLYSLDISETDCYSGLWGDDYMSAHVDFDWMYFTWSPDSQYLSIAQYPFVQGYDSDIWLFDLTTREFTNATEDGATGIVVSPASLFEMPPIDYLPTWISPGQLLFFRTYPTQNEAIRLGEQYDGLYLYEMAVDHLEPRLIIDLSGFFHYEILSAAISTSGDRLAILGVTSNRELGVWLLDLQTLEMVQIMSSFDLLDDFFDWLPSISVRSFSNSSLVWMPDDSGILILLLWSSVNNLSFPNAYYVDPDTKEFAPIVDFSSIPSPESDEAAISNFFDKIPISFFVSYDMDTLYYVSGIVGADENPVYSIQLLPNLDLNPVLLGEARFTHSHRGSLQRISETGLVLVDGRTFLTFLADE